MGNACGIFGVFDADVRYMLDRMLPRFCKLMR